jgi:hypothetical protein
LLENHELKVTLDSPKEDYRFEYYTTTLPDGGAGKSRWVRTYRLIDLIRGGVTQEPWDSYDLEKQTKLASGLIDLCGYKISKIVEGWTIKCPSCGQVVKGKIWDVPPKACVARDSKKCGQRFESEDVVENTYCA